MPADDQPLVLDVADYEGTPVRCGAQRWAEKIDANHPELTGRQADVELTIRDPDRVLQDRDYGNRRHHLRRGDDGLYVDVVVEYEYREGAITGRLVTAMVRRRLRTGDTLLYSREVT